METVKKIGSIIISVILWLIILLAALFAFTTLATSSTTGSVANIAGFTPMSVESESMSPTFNKGDMIIVQQVDTSTLEEGDVISFHTIVDNTYSINTHRIESITEENGVRNYTTKGDNNEISDTHIISDVDIIGKEVAVIPGLGNVMDFLSSPVGFLVVIVLPLLLFFIYQVYHLITISINLKRATQEEDRQAEAERIVKAQEAAESEALSEAERKRAEAEAMLAEAKRMKEEAEALANHTEE